MGPKVEEQAEFLLRFLYYETLIKTMKALKVGTKNMNISMEILPFDLPWVLHYNSQEE